MSSECTGKVVGMRLVSAMTAPFFSPAKCFYLGRLYRRLTKLPDQSNVSISTADRLLDLPAVRKQLRTEIGFAILEIIPLLGSIIRQVHDLSGKSGERDEGSAFDVFWGYRAKSAATMAKQLIDEAHRIERQATIVVNGRGRDGLEENVEDTYSELSILQIEDDAESRSNGEPQNLSESLRLLPSVESTPDLPGGDGEGFRFDSSEATPDLPGGNREGLHFDSSESTLVLPGGDGEGVYFEPSDSLESTPDLIGGPTGGLHYASFDSIYSGEHQPTHYYFTQSCPDLTTIGRDVRETAV